VGQISPNEVGMSTSDRCLQRRLWIEEILLRSGGICDQVAKLSEILQKILCWPVNFFLGGGGGPQMSDKIL